jgi:hypothetical protein
VKVDGLKKRWKGIAVVYPFKIIFERYTKEYGYGVRNLAQYQVIITGGSLFEGEMPEIVEYENNTKRYLLLDVLKELMVSS